MRVLDIVATGVLVILPVLAAPPYSAQVDTPSPAGQNATALEKRTWCPFGGQWAPSCSIWGCGQSNQYCFLSCCMTCSPGTQVTESDSWDWPLDPSWGLSSLGDDGQDSGWSLKKRSAADGEMSSPSKRTDCFTCSKCPANTFSPDGSPCQHCPAGATSPPGATRCQCPSGQFVQNGRCSPCPAGQSSDGYSCTVCPANYISSSGGQCHQCPTGQTNNNAHTACIPQASAGLYKRKNPEDACGPRHVACPLLGGLRGSTGGYECVDTQNDIQSCGGCWSTGEGEDCTAFDPYASASCVKGVCQYTCPTGFKLTVTGCERLDESAELGLVSSDHQATLHPIRVLGRGMAAAAERHSI